MLKRLPSPVRGVLSFLLYTFNTLFWTVPILLWAIFKLLIPIAGWRKICDRILNGSANQWVGVNTRIQNLFCKTKWTSNDIDALPEKGWYLILSNHQSWVDILVLQRIFHRRIPFLKFFLKKELFWVPVLGLAWWALDFPFMKRYSRTYIKKHPKRAGKDLEITRKACEKFKTTPISIMNFVEGTRFTEEKHRIQNPPFKNLLKTHAGGIAYVLAAMGRRIDRIIDVTVVYPTGVKRFWEFICGDIDEIRVHIDAIPVSEDLIGDYVADREFRSRFHVWLNALWKKKDERFELIKYQWDYANQPLEIEPAPQPVAQSTESASSHYKTPDFSDSRTPASA
jgi:1-acyl-sn-glycerol-3-phosphate acyltransferase